MFKRFIAITLLMLSASVSASETEVENTPIALPKGYPSAFENRGTVQGVQLEGGVYINISGENYAVDSGVIIHLLDSSYGSLRTLKSGMGVGFRLTKVGNSMKIIELWELPGSLAPKPS